MTGMQKPHEEKLREFLQEIRQELDFIVQPCDLHVEMVRNLVAKAIELQMEERNWEAWKILVSACEVSRQTSVEKNSQAFWQILYVLDIGFFAKSLGHQVYEIEDVAKEIWRERKVFSPNLSDAAYAAERFATHLRKGKGVKRSFRYALREPNTMYKVLGASSMYGNKPIGHVLKSAALTRLKGLLRAYVLAQPYW